MAWHEISERKREELKERIESVGRWLRQHEPAKSVTEDLLGHQLRTLLVALRDDVELGRQSRVRRQVDEIEMVVHELWKARQLRT